MDKILEQTKRITDPMYDVCGDPRLTAGQTLTVLKLAREAIDVEIERWSEAIEQKTAR